MNNYELTKIAEIRERAEKIEDQKLRKKALSALDSFQDVTKAPIVSDALKLLRRSRNIETIRLAKDIAQLAVGIQPHNPFFIGELALILGFLNEGEEVIKLLEDFFKKVAERGWQLASSQKEYLIVTLSHAYARLGRVPEGLILLTELKSDAPNVVEAMAELYCHGGYPEQTVQLLTNKITLTVKMAKWLAKSYLRLGNTEKAQQVLSPFEESPMLREVYEEITAEKGVMSVKTSSLTQQLDGASCTISKVFVSHSKKDAVLARRVRNLICQALGLRKPEVRCTSVDASGLPVGADTSQTLASDILGSTVFIGLLTEKSVQSDYVLFELGASWIMSYAKAGHRTFPLLGSGVPFDVLPGPLKGRNAIKTDNRADIQQMLLEAAEALGGQLLPPHEYSEELEDLLECGKP